MKLNKVLGQIGLLVALVLPFAANSTIITIDNSSAGFSSVGFTESVANCCVGYAIGDNYMVDTVDSEGDYAMWDPSSSTDWLAGIWTVEINWTSYANRATSALVTIGTGLDTIFVDQTIGGGVWQNVGDFSFSSAGSFVMIDDSNSLAGEYVVADAIKFTFVSALPSAAEVSAPATLLIMVLGLCGLGLVKRKKL